MIKKLFSANMERNSNIEVLRILAICGVIILHYINRDGGAEDYVALGSISSAVLIALNATFTGCVDLFMLISGYCSAGKTSVSLFKPIQLIFQVVVFQELIYVLNLCLGAEFSVTRLVGMLIPANYFVILYCAVYLLSPYINILFQNLSDRSCKQLVVCLFLLFSVWPMLVDVLINLSGSKLIGLSTIAMDGTGAGYTFVNFVLMYILGVYLARMKKNIALIPKKHLIIMAIISWIIVFSWMWIADNMRIVNSASCAYYNPFIIVFVMNVFLLIGRKPVRVSKTINTLSKSVFTTYLFHNFLLDRCSISQYASMSPIFCIGHMLIVIIGIYVICFAVHTIYCRISAPFIKLVSGLKPCQWCIKVEAEVGERLL